MQDLFGDTSNPKVSLRELVETRLENTSVKKNRVSGCSGPKLSLSSIHGVQVAAQTFYEMLVLKSKGTSCRIDVVDVCVYV